MFLDYAVRMLVERTDGGIFIVKDDRLHTDHPGQKVEAPEALASDRQCDNF
jgi:hypothetical protein